MAQTASHPLLLTALPRSLLPASPSPTAPTGEGAGWETPPAKLPLKVTHREQEEDRVIRAAGGVFWGILWRVGEPQVWGGGEESPCSGQGPSLGAAMAGGAGPRPTAPAVSLSDELHAIRRC